MTAAPAPPIGPDAGRFAAPLADLTAETLASALRDRVFGLRLGRARTGFCGVLALSGKVALEGGGEGVPLRAPALLWTPWTPGLALRLRAGSSAAHVLLSDEVLAMALGHNADSADLARLARARTVVPLAAGAEALAECRQALSVIAREVAAPGPGSESLVQGHVRVLLVHIWRSGAGASGPAEPAALQLLQRFRTLLEMHFRTRWPVAAYAAALGISADRLHGLCRRHLGKPPRQLVQERQMHEARLMLERSTQTVEQVAGRLGFADAAQFSRFFAARAGLPPARYRRQIVAGKGAHAPTPAGYADWP